MSSATNQPDKCKTKVPAVSNNHINYIVDKTRNNKSGTTSIINGKPKTKTEQ